MQTIRGSYLGLNTSTEPSFGGSASSLLWAWLLFWVLSGCTEILLAFSGVVSFEGVKDALLTSALWLLPLIWWPTQAKKLSAVMAVVIWMGALPGLGYFVIYHQELTQSLMMILFESNPAESKEYLLNYASFKVFAVLALYTFVPFLLWPKIGPVRRTPTQAVIWTILIMLVLFANPFIKSVRAGAINPAYENLNRHFAVASPWQLFFGYMNYQRDLAIVEQNLLQMDRIPPLKEFHEEEKPLPTTAVLVIGESTNRLHMGIYGYQRETNPKLSLLKDELHVFKNVYAPRPNTIESLEQVLTFADQHHPQRYMTSPSLIALMRQAGYKTIWITNQQTLTKRNTMLTTFAKQASEQVFLNTSRKQNAYSFDEKVLVPFSQALKNPAPKKLIIVHLLGTHMKYDYRYPQSYAVFNTREGLSDVLPDDSVETVNAYDNAVRYNDEIIYRLITALKHQHQHSLLVYFSDHGDDVFDSGNHDFQGRNEAQPTLPMYAIPFIVWHSENWFNQTIFNNPAILDRQYDNGDFIYTWSDLLGIHYSAFQPHESLVNSTFMPDEIEVGNPFGKSLQRLEGTQPVAAYMHH